MHNAIMEWPDVLEEPEQVQSVLPVGHMFLSDILDLVLDTNHANTLENKIKLEKKADRSPRSQDVRASVRDTMLKSTLKQFLGP